MNRLQLDGLEKTFGASPAVAALDLCLRPGEFVSLLGPSGCGKTTTLRMIAGLERPSAGHILIDGRAVGDLAPEARGIGLVSQHFALFPHMNVRQNVAFGLKVRGMSGAEQSRAAEAMLARVQLAGYADRFPHQLSGGQMQRVALARTLVTEPAILLLDEPLSNLDASLRGEMRQLIKALHEDFEMTTILVTHDQSDALSMSDRVAVMFGGRIVQSDPPHALYDRPRTAEIARFIGDANIVPGAISQADGTMVIDLGFVALPAHGPEFSGSADFVIRPERLELLAHRPDRDIAFPARVTTAAFEGGASTYTLQTRGSTLHARQSGAAPLETGTDVWVRIAPDALHRLS